jgi:SAM-dependent methyltransferase
MAASKSLTETFTEIYSKNIWKDGKSASGPGSDLEATKEYREVIQKFLSENDVRSAVDFGCGDWESTRMIDWTGTDYLGIDLVQSVVEKNQAEFGAENIRFEVGDLSEHDSCSADLLICKDVLQHLPNSIISDFLTRTLLQYRWAILTNDARFSIPGGFRNLWRRIDPYGPANVDTNGGGYHTLLLRQSPFNLKAKLLLRYDLSLREAIFTKEVLLWENPNK